MCYITNIYKGEVSNLVITVLNNVLCFLLPLYSPFKDPNFNSFQISVYLCSNLFLRKNIKGPKKKNQTKKFKYHLLDVFKDALQSYSCNTTGVIYSEPAQSLIVGQDDSLEAFRGQWFPTICPCIF